MPELTDEEAAILACDTLAVVAHELFRSACSGGLSDIPYLRRLFEDLKNPQPGDMVLEITSAHRYKSYQRMGKLVSVADEEAGKCWKIERVFTDGTIETWRNAEFIKVPQTRFKI